ncbi:hypothetical protein [Azohydromonas aeria]|uniref:hypothetical protein n=1 Tax=Azohydromonas aeria TaxID=2590212 RepID=UPI0012FCF910|nr:hypothetical protein [Azohydromonas aeria]
MYGLSMLRSTLCSLEEQLALARDRVMACDTVPRKQFAPVHQALDAAIDHVKGMVNERGVEALALAEAHFARVGLVPGAVVDLSYPLYGSRLDAAFDEDRIPRRLARATLKVEGFTVEHVRGPAEVVLGVSGRVVHEGKPGKEVLTCPLHPGCAFELLKPAPARLALPAPSPKPAEDGPEAD